MSGENWSVRVLGRFKKAVKKISTMLSLNRTKWRLSCFHRRASARRGRLSLSFNDRLGLHDFIEDELSRETSTPVRVLQRVTSYGDGSDDDVDKRAEIFISNFRRQLWYERQTSLELRYCRTRSLDKD